MPEILSGADKLQIREQIGRVPDITYHRHMKLIRKLAEMILGFIIGIVAFNSLWLNGLFLGGAGHGTRFLLELVAPWWFAICVWVGLFTSLPLRKYKLVRWGGVLWLVVLYVTSGIRCVEGKYDLAEEFSQLMRLIPGIVLLTFGYWIIFQTALLMVLFERERAVWRWLLGRAPFTEVFSRDRRAP